ncbi:DUF559 domain-containing protein (plasmid) [Bacillus mycoides]|uniref:DUF559 domain-containing protein n=1 Tax=Bacillus mycoides TaxID=1405 RepID=UPI001C00B3BF|nr:DUF559 domain-containing protein [Bacillus mycoides]QWG31468.1 DUF559 domain-containing protein [Bacillus mycoides]
MLFSGDQFNADIFVPNPSPIQQEVYEALYRRCYDDNRFDGPGNELRIGRCSLDIFFWGKKGEKICYEIDGNWFHNKEDDKRRDYYLKKNGWKVFRVKVSSIDAFGVEEIAEMIFQHLLKQLGYSSGIILPNIITSYYEGNIH